MICKTLWKITLLQTSEIKKRSQSHHLPALSSLLFSTLLSPCPTSPPKIFSTSWQIPYPPILAFRNFRHIILTFIALKQEDITSKTSEWSDAVNYFKMWQLSPYVTYNIHTLLVYRPIAYSWHSARIYIDMCGLLSSTYSSTNWREIKSSMRPNSQHFHPVVSSHPQPAKLSNNIMRWKTKLYESLDLNTSRKRMWK